MKSNRPAMLGVGLFALACMAADPEPVEIFPEDACSFCRMAVSDRRFASEIITTESEVFKFDDIGCLRQFRETRLEDPVAALFYIGYDSGQWLPEKKAVVVRTGIGTPMGSGFLAFEDAGRAGDFVEKHPPEAPQ